MFLVANSAAGIRGISASCITRAGGQSLPPAQRRVAKGVTSSWSSSSRPSWQPSWQLSSWPQYVLRKTSLGGEPLCTAPCNATRCHVLQKPIATPAAERLLLALLLRRLLSRRLPRASDQLFTPSVAITDMTAMLSLQLVSIFCIFHKSSRGNREIAHKFWHNFLTIRKAASRKEKGATLANALMLHFAFAGAVARCFSLAGRATSPTPMCMER